MSEDPVNELLATFLDQVEQLAHRYESLSQENKKLRQKAQNLQERVAKLENQNEALQEKMDQNRLEFSELAGSLENRLNEIKEEASELVPDEHHE